SGTEACSLCSSAAHGRGAKGRQRQGDCADDLTADARAGVLLLRHLRLQTLEPDLLGVAALRFGVAGQTAIAPASDLEQQRGRIGVLLGLGTACSGEACQLVAEAE